MAFLWIGVGVAACLVLVLLMALLCFLMAFYTPRKEDLEHFDVPSGEIYEPFRDTMITWMKELRAMPHEEISITSFDGLTLRGKYYEGIPGAPIELMFHGYRGTSERDLCGGVRRCFALGRNVLLVDQRASGYSDGHVITFGVHESKDCLAWIDYLIGRFGDDSKIILTGISMGAATVLTAASYPLPQNVVGILADCGYTSAKDIIKKVIRDMKLPADLLYPFVRLGARLYGHFDPEERSPVEAMETCTIPVIFIHGEDDDYVPCEMSRINYETCVAPKKLVTIPGAGHGLCYMVDRDAYFDELADFFNRNGVPTTVSEELA